jgi:hypothetical protein
LISGMQAAIRLVAGVGLLFLGTGASVAVAEVPGCPAPRAPFDGIGSDLSAAELDTAVRAWIDGTGFQGVLLTAPRHAPCDGALQLSGWYVRSLREDLDTRFHQEAILVAADLGRGAAYVAPAFPTAKQPTGGDFPPGYDPGPGVVVSRFTVDPRAALGRPLEAGHYLLSVLYRGASARPAQLTIRGNCQPNESDLGAIQLAADAVVTVRFQESETDRSLPDGTMIGLRTARDGKSVSGVYRLPPAGGDHLLVVLSRPSTIRFRLFELPEHPVSAVGQERAGSFSLRLDSEPVSRGSWLYALAPCGGVASADWAGDGGS